MGLDLSKKVLWVSVGQRVADLQAVKVGGHQNSANQPARGQNEFEPGRSTEFFVDLQL